ncbi:MAG: alpha amylase [Alphaproteobacteria bacterium]|nr:alpha amylase [Alphaproteobacteria bacterium]
MADILDRKKTSFVLWRPKTGAAPPVLVIGRFKAGNPSTLDGARRFDLRPASGFDDLFTLDAIACELEAGGVYHYWFDVEDTYPGRTTDRVLVTDPFAWTVDWRLLAPPRATPDNMGTDRHPAAVVLWTGEQLAPCDPGGERPDLSSDTTASNLPPNNRLVIYEMPTAWSRQATPDDLGIGVGTFQDVAALIDAAASAPNFDDLALTMPGRAYLRELGINALELLPPADSFDKREWGYGTANYLAPDTDLGFPETYTASTSNRDFAALVKLCHASGIRVFADVVMAFGKHNAYQTIAYPEFCVGPGAPASDPDALNSRPEHEPRDGFGSVLWRYARPVNGYDPASGNKLDALYPARQLMLVFAERWLADFHIDGIRMDSVENVANWDFVQTFKDQVRSTFLAARGAGVPEAEARILVVGEELSVPLDLLTQRRLDGLWNLHFSTLVRNAMLGWGDDFEAVVRHMIDCRGLGFKDGAQAVNYIASHDVEGLWNMRPYDFLLRCSVPEGEIIRRIKLGFACLLTAVGIPMILAGDEFADLHDRFDRNGDVDQHGGKQVDPVDYSRATNDATRTDLLKVVSRLVKLRTSHPALAVNDTQFIHIDLTPGRRVFAWTRGDPADPVVVVANFSAWGTEAPLRPGAEYIVPNWPAGGVWREVTLDRTAPQAGREPLFPWEAKVYRHA